MRDDLLAYEARFTEASSSDSMKPLWQSCVRSPSTLLERRLVPASNTFLNVDEAAFADTEQEVHPSSKNIRRSSSFSGYLPVEPAGNLWFTEDALQRSTIDGPSPHHAEEKSFCRSLTESTQAPESSLPSTGEGGFCAVGQDSDGPSESGCEEMSLADTTCVTKRTESETIASCKSAPGEDTRGKKGPMQSLTSEEVMLKSITTLMLHNLPFALTQEELLDVVNKTGFGEWYDYAYAPYNMKDCMGHGYAFINFVTVEAAAIFVDEWTGTSRFAVPGWSAGKPVCFSAATSQGYAAHVNSRTMNKLHRIRNPRLWPYMAPSSIVPSGRPGRSRQAPTS
mmetsp:Transcript_42812/g.98139  ORF Transcript_42812/g.98139 Transcript_42812/m.98139 type:complete len:338 (-) Transcript_42812:116-1129(-)